MTKGIVLYKSKYGASKWYADKIASNCGFESKDIKQTKISDIKDYDVIVFCGSVYASGISYRKFLNKNYDKIKDKTIILFFIGASPYDEKTFQKVIHDNFRSEILSLPIFYGRGKWDLDKMSFIHRTLCKMLMKMVAKKDSDTIEPWEQALMETQGKSCDWTDEKYIQPIIEYVSKLK